MFVARRLVATARVIAQDTFAEALFKQQAVEREPGHGER